MEASEQMAAECEITAPRVGLDLAKIAENVAMYQITVACNFHCVYCCAASPGRPPDPRPRYSNTDVLAAFEQTGRSWWFVISGGETFLYPKFEELLAMLTQAGHYVSVDTNLSHEVDGVLADVPPEQVVMFSCAYHAESEKRPEAKEAFQRRVCDLADHGFRVTIPYVMHPKRFDDYARAKDEFGKLGFKITPQPCRTTWKGDTYPQSYTDEQREVIYGDQVRPMLFDLPEYVGSLCGAGHRLVRIMPDGRVYRCPGHQTQLGELAQRRLDLFDEPRPCDQTVCNCNRFVRQIDLIPGHESMIDSFVDDITINESRIRR